MARGSTLRFLLFAAVSLVLTVAIGATIAGTSFDARTELLARVDDVGGLRAGDDVRLAGVRVGSVEDIAVEEGRAVVRFAVDADIGLPTDTTARVQWVDLIGSNELLLLPGEASSTLSEGDELTATTSAADLAELADAFGPLTQTLDPDRINELTATVLTVLEGREGDLSRLLTDLEVALATFTEREDTVDRLLQDYALLAETVARREGQITTLVDHLLVAAETFDRSDDVLAAAISDTGRFLGNLDAFLDAAADDLGGVLDDLLVVTDTVVEELDTLERGVVALPGTLDAVLRATDRGDAVSLDATCVSLTAPPCLSPLPTAGTGSLRSADGDALRQLLLGGEAGR